MSIHILDKNKERKKRVQASVVHAKNRNSSKEKGNKSGGDDLTILRNEIGRLQSILSKKDEQISHLNEQNLHFLNSAAHDLRNPLGVIQMYCDFMRSEPDENFDEPVREFISIISSTGTQMQQIINKMLDYSKLESGRISLEKMPVETDHLLNKVILTYTPKASSHNISLIHKSFDTGSVLNIDGQRIEQALNYLIDNAIKFSHPGTTITISSKSADGGLKISVKDEGQGIPGNEYHKLFKPFSKTSVQPLNGDSRTGLGLALVKTIVEKHNGTVGFSSQAGQGSDFYFWLPI